MGVDPAVPVEQRPGIRTFLIADVRGYTSFTQERGDEEGTKLAARFAAVAREVIDDAGGAVIELRGDEVLAEFASARGAIRAATSLQQRFLEETEADPRLPLPVGIGLDAGEAVPYESGYRGGALNLASRLCGRAGPGEILVSQGVVLLARKVEGVRLVDRGELQLKGLTERVRVFRAVPEGTDPAERIRLLTQRGTARGPAAVRLARRHPLWAALIALALVAAVVVPTTLLGGEGPADPIVGDALAMVDLDSGKVEGSVSLEGRPGDVAVGAGGVWVTVPDRGVVMRIDRASMTVRNTIPVGAEPSGIAVGEGSVWVSNGGSSTVSRISPETETVVETIDVPGGPAGIAVGFGGVWVANSFGASVSRIDPRTGKLLTTIPVGDRPVDVAIGDDAVWVANSASDTISRIDPAENKEGQPTRVGKGPLAIASGPSGIWVANTQDGTVSRIDPGGDSVAQTIEVDDEPTDLALTEGSVWVADGSLGSLTRIDITSGSREKIELGTHADALVVGEDTMWVGVRGSAAAHLGGTLTVWGVGDLLGSLDPALAYYAQSWALLTLTNDGLVGFRRTGGVDGTTLVPSLARSLPEPSPDGKTYTFHLRPGIRYSDGSSLRPEDFRRAIERVFAQVDGDGNRSGGVQFFTSIIGAEECEPAKACDLSDGILADDDSGTVTFQLTKADPDFLYKLALPFASAVPAETPDDLGNGAIPATGPYVMDSSADERIVLSRNPQFRSWSEAARPEGFPDRIIWKLGSDLEEMAGRVLEDDADLMFALPAAESFDELASDHAGQLHLEPSQATFFMSLNTRAAPFDDVMVRRAVNFAVDRRKVQRLIGLATSPTCQILPPNFPGYVAYCPYTRRPGVAWTAPDLPKAKRLVRESGTAGTKVAVWSAPSFFPSVSSYFADLLRDLGYRVALKKVDDGSYQAALYGRPRGSQIAFAGWTTDYPAGSSFIGALFKCGVPFNESGFCNEELNRRMERAAGLQTTDLQGAYRAWTSIDHDLVDLAPSVPLVARYWVNLVSRRLGNFQVNTLGLLVDQMWVR